MLTDKIMQHLFVIRHANYSKDGLTDEGIKSVQRLSHEIKQYVQNGDYILSSSAPRARWTAESLTAELSLSLQTEYLPLLWTGSDGQRESFYRSEKGMKELDDKVQKAARAANSITLVGHLELTDWYPFQVLWERYHALPKGMPEFEKGWAFHLNLNAENYRIIGPNNSLVLPISKLPNVKDFCRYCDLANNVKVCDDGQRRRALGMVECHSAKAQGEDVTFNDQNMGVYWGWKIEYPKSDQGIEKFRADLEQRNIRRKESEKLSGTEGTDWIDEDDVPF